MTWRAGDAKGRPATRGPALGELGRDPAGEGAGFTPETAPSSALPDGFAYLDEVVPGARWEVRYATRDNFTGEPVDGYLVNRIVGARELVAALARVQEEAASLGLGVYVWDAYRPRRAVERFARWAQQPEDGRTKRRYYPNLDKRELFEKGFVAARSAHSRGGAVDLTLCDQATGQLLDMGTDFDFMDPLSRHGAAQVGRVAARNRRLLRTVMEAWGFTPYELEWWHYTLLSEPFPDAYFDFPVR